MLDQYKISAVMIEPLGRGRTRISKLKDSPNWIPFYDDGRIVMFGRKDAPAGDLPVFESNRLEPARLYHATNPLPPSEGPPTPTSWIDDVFQNRSLDRAQMRTQSAWRWLMAGPGLASGQRGSPSRRAACWRSRTPASRCRAAPTTRWPSASSTRPTAC